MSVCGISNRQKKKKTKAADLSKLETRIVRVTFLS